MISLFRRLPGRPRSRAQALVEFALVAPVACMMMLGGLEMGWMVFNKSAGVNAAREAARTGSMGYSETVIIDVANRNTWGLQIQEVIYSVTDPNGVAKEWPTRAHKDILTVTTVMRYDSLTTVFNFVPGLRITEFRTPVVVAMENGPTP